MPPSHNTSTTSTEDGDQVTAGARPGLALHDTLTHGIAAAFGVGAIFTACAVVVAVLVVKKIRSS